MNKGKLKQDERRRRESKEEREVGEEGIEGGRRKT